MGAVNICKWRYKYFEQKDSIPAEGNTLCVEDPSGTGANMASHTLKEIVTVARESLVEMATEAFTFVNGFRNFCQSKEVWPFNPALDAVNPRYCSQYYRGEYNKWIKKPSDAEKMRRGCLQRLRPMVHRALWCRHCGSVRCP